MQFSAEAIQSLNARFEDRRPREILRWALERFQEKLVFLLGFGVEGMMILDLLFRIDPGQTFKVVTLDTERLHDETYPFMDVVRDRYNLRYERLRPDPSAVAEMNRIYGEDLYAKSRELARLCCKVRKVDQMPQALHGAEACISSIRREQSDGRENARMVEVDGRYEGGLLKLYPLILLTEDEVWDYVRKNNVPYHPLHAKGFRSIGCKDPCTVASIPGGGQRSGRFPLFPDSGDKECGVNCISRHPLNGNGH